VGLLRSSTVDATTHSATRSFSSDQVEAGGTLVITIEVSGIRPGAKGFLSHVEETLPSGFSYESTNLEDGAVDQGQVVKFPLLGAMEFTYTVTAPDTPDSYQFEGTVVDENFDKGDPGQIAMVGGASMITVVAAAGYGRLGRVVETLPAGFTYESSSLPSTSVRVAGQVVTFALLGEETFMYTYSYRPRH
jgi:hypothetical protein